jgi:putative ABC transport system permease protein
MAFTLRSAQGRVRTEIIDGLKSVLSHRLRSSLTAIGIIVAVSSVTLITALGEAAETKVSRSLDGLSGRLVLVYQVAPPPGAALLRRKILTERDVALIVRDVPGVRRAAAQVSGRARLVAGGRMADTSLQGVGAEYLSFGPIKIATGRFLTPADVRSGAMVAILGRSVADRLFPNDGAIGRRVRIGGVPAEVVGTAANRSGGLTSEGDNIVLVPISAARQRLGFGVPGQPDAVSQVLIEVSPTVSLESTQDAVTALIKKQKRVRDDDLDPFYVTTSKELARAAAGVISIIQSVLTAIASISLLVGGIGVANVMFASVAERTSEIGLRMAVGATPARIRRQFLLESSVLCVLGGIGGVILSGLIVGILRAATDLPISLSIGSMVLALTISTAAGLLFGYLPARQASRIDPIAALRRD